MALLGNYSVLNKTPMRKFGGTTESAERSNFSTSGSVRNVQLQDRATAALPLYGKPGGYYPNYAWQIPQIAGALGSNGAIVGSGDASTSNLASGQYVAASLSGSGAITSAIVTALGNMASSLTGSGVIFAATASGIAAASVSMTGDVTTSQMVALGNLIAAMTGLGSVSALGSMAGDLSATLSGLASSTALVSGTVPAAASLSGSSSLSGQMQSAALMSAALSGSGIMATAQSNAAILAAATLSGSSVVAAGGSMAGGLVATLTGSGGSSDVVMGVWPMVGALTGSSSLSASLTALGWQVANLSGSGVISNALPNAPASIGVTIKSFGDLSPEGLASAVWSALASNFTATGSMGQKMNGAGSAGNPWTEVIESGLTAEEILRLISAVLLGKSSGAAGTTMVFRDIADTKDRIVATLDGQGDRLSVARDAS